MAQYAHEWKMPLAFYKGRPVKERIWSPAFQATEYAPLKFYLRAFPHGDSEENSGYIAYFIFCEPPNGQTIVMDYTLYVKDEYGNVIAESPWTGTFGPLHQTWGKRRFCRRPIVSEGNDEGKFITFGCKLAIRDFDPSKFKKEPTAPIESLSSESFEKPLLKPEISRSSETLVIDTLEEDSTRASEKSEKVEEALSEVLKTSEAAEKALPVVSKMNEKISRLYKSMELADVIISVGNAEIKAHKLILYLHSPCLAAMLKHDEGFTETRIEIEQFCAFTVEKALEYMYTEVINDLESLSVSQKMELHRFASVFAITDLKDFIKAKVIDSIEPSSACEVADLSELYNEEEIRLNALEVIAKNLQALKLEESFRNLSGENAKALLQII